MKFTKIVIAVISILFFCFKVYAQPVIIDDNSLSKIDNSGKSCIKEATDDFDAVVNGKLPIHAKVDTSMPLPADGGTVYYIGKGYKLTIIESLAKIGGIDGYYYGPIIVFNEGISSGNFNLVSDVRFYSLKNFKKLFKQ